MPIRLVVDDCVVLRPYLLLRVSVIDNATDRHQIDYALDQSLSVTNLRLQIARILKISRRPSALYKRDQLTTRFDDLKDCASETKCNEWI